MNTQPATANQFRCLTWSPERPLPEAVSSLLSASRRIEGCDHVETEAQLCESLKLKKHPLCVLVLNNRYHMLPACLLRYPDLKVLVVTRFGKIGPLVDWLQQGASDIVQSKKPDHLRHALSRLIDECALQQHNLQLLEKIHVLEHAQATHKISEPQTSKALLHREKTLAELDQLVQDLRADPINKDGASTWPTPKHQRLTLMMINWFDGGRDTTENHDIETSYNELCNKTSELLREALHHRVVAGLTSKHSMLIALPLSQEHTPRSLVCIVKAALLSSDHNTQGLHAIKVNTITANALTADTDTLVSKLTQRSRASIEKRLQQQARAQRAPAPQPGGAATSDGVAARYSSSILATV